MKFDDFKTIQIEIDPKIKKIFEKAHASWIKTKYGFKIKIKADYVK